MVCFVKYEEHLHRFELLALLFLWKLVNGLFKLGPGGIEVRLSCLQLVSLQFTPLQINALIWLKDQNFALSSAR